jgi:nucleoside-diphosphate-sugar epimerase
MWNGGGGVVQLWGDGRNPLPFVLVEDVASALLAAMNAEGLEGESFNLASDPCMSALDYVAALEDVAGIKLQVFPTPIWRFYLCDILKWVVKILVKHPERRLPSYWDWETRTARATFDCTKAKRLLGWQPTQKRLEIIARGIRQPVEELLA